MLGFSVDGVSHTYSKPVLVYAADESADGEAIGSDDDYNQYDENINKVISPVLKAKSIAVYMETIGAYDY